MRIQTLVVTALLTLPCGLSAQSIRLPRTGRGTAPEPAPLPPPAAPVGRALALQRSRWSAEGYSLFSTIETPAVGGGVTRSSAFGTGTHAGYRYADRFTATIDLTAAFLGGSAITETGEAGTRFSPLGWDGALDHGLRPFFDVRAAYMHAYDSFSNPAGPAGGVGGPNQGLAEESRYSRGFGGIGGAGVEYSLTPTLALTTELLAMRNRMTTYRFTGTANIPGGTSYWMTSLRWTLGLKFNPVSTLHLAQNPTS